MRSQQLSSASVFPQRIVFPAHFEEDVSQLVMLVCNRQLTDSQHFPNVFQRQPSQTDCFFVSAQRCVVHREEIVELSSCWVVLPQPKGVLCLFQLVDAGGLLGKSLLYAPFHCQ